VANFLASMGAEPGVAAHDRLAAVTTLSFDIAVLELMLPLAVGAQVLVVPRETAMDGNRLRALLESSGATVMQATPGMWRMLLDTDWQGGAAFKALVGGESCPPDLAGLLLDRCGELWNMYGPTETTVWSTVWRVDRAQVLQRGMSIGRPIANTSVRILDSNLQACPIGVPGEICIGGTGVALGYLDRPELTADRFKPDAFSASPGALMYRTGDRGRWRNDGLLEHLGRLDFQVKVRGYRIELGEIEAGCNEVAAVAQSVVLAREDHPGDVRLVAYLTPNPGMAFDEAALRAHLRGRLPEYMLPQHVCVLEAMPLLPNGKVDRKALPAPDVTPVAGSEQRVPPRNESESTVVAAMEAVLNLPGLGIHDDFFALGGHSLLAARLTARLNRDLGLDLPLRALFESPTAEKLAIAVDRARGADAPKRAPILHDAARRSAPLTPMQERIRFVEELHPGRVVYNTPSAHRLTGPMDVAKFEQALREMVRRQPALRTHVGVAPNGQGHVQVIETDVEFSMPCVDLTSVESSQREVELMRLMQAIIDTPIDICGAPLFRVALYRLAEDQHAFLFMPHHIIWDGWSFDLLYEEMSAIYSALSDSRAVPLPPLAVTYGDYAQWQAEWMRGPDFAAQLRYWKNRFAAAPMPKAPRPDNARRAGMTGEGASEWVRLDSVTTERLREIARGADATLNMLTMAVYTAMMAAIVDSASIVIGMPVRGRAQAELEPVMGFFNNLLPVQLEVPGQRKVVDFVRDIKQELLEVFSYQDVPFERLALEPEVASRTQRVGLYQALFSFQDARDRMRQWGALKQQGILIFQKGATEDLGLWLMEVPSGIEGGFTYNADLYTAETAAAFRERFVELVQRLAANPAMSVADLTASAGSAAAAYLRRLAAEDVPATLPGPAMARRSVTDATLTETERAVAEIWAALLNVDAGVIGADDRFFAMGGNSLQAMQLVAQTERRFSRKLLLNDLVTDPTIRELATLMGAPVARDSLALIRAGGARPPVFLVHDGDGETLLYRNLAQHLSAEHPVYGLQPHSAEGHALLYTRLSDMAAHHIRNIRRVQPNGPYLLGGLCAGGVIAYEIARQLRQQGESIAMLALIDAADVAVTKKAGRVTGRRLKSFSSAFNTPESQTPLRSVATGLFTAAGKVLNLLTYEVSSRIEKFATVVKVRLLRHHLDRGSAPPSMVRSLSVSDIYQFALLDDSNRALFDGDVALFRATATDVAQDDEPYIERYSDPLFGWPKRISGTVHCFDVPGGHFTMLREPHAQVMAQAMQSYIDQALGVLLAPPVRGMATAPGTAAAEPGRDDRSALAA
jgi:non-ribosomal peptide synthetase component F/thioesterase domain-containing protein